MITDGGEGCTDLVGYSTLFASNWKKFKEVPGFRWAGFFVLVGRHDLRHACS
jgi:hypothetical protein